MTQLTRSSRLVFKLTVLLCCWTAVNPEQGAAVGQALLWNHSGTVQQGSVYGSWSSLLKDVNVFVPSWVCLIR